MKSLGGMKVAQSDFLSQKEISFESSPYVYKLLDISHEFTTSSLNLVSMTIYLLSSDSKVSLEERGHAPFFLSPGDIAQIESSDVILKGNGRILVGGVSFSRVSLTPSVRVFTNSQIKRVEKHWGYELWLNGEHPLYSFKKIFLKAGTKTSLQYHQKKSETNVLTTGEARLYFKTRASTPNDLVKFEDLGSEPIHEGSCIGVSPQIIHRIEAVTDCILFEVSTPHLDDVIRIADDKGRSDGRLAFEHATVKMGDE